MNLMAKHQKVDVTPSNILYFAIKSLMLRHQTFDETKKFYIKISR